MPTENGISGQGSVSEPAKKTQVQGKHGDFCGSNLTPHIRRSVHKISQNFGVHFMTATEHGSSRNRLSALAEIQTETDKWQTLFTSNRSPHNPETGCSG